jgi:hypothetical protein
MEKKELPPAYVVYSFQVIGEDWKDWMPGEWYFEELEELEPLKRGNPTN